MSKFAISSTIIGLLLLALMYAAPAEAQATRTWVSGVGDDVNPCSRTAPCKTFAGAISKTAAGGEISVLDPGGFGAVTITKAISLTNDGVGEAGVLASNTTGITVNAGPNDVVNLRGLVIDGAPAATPGLVGIHFIAGHALHIQQSVIKNFQGAAPNGFGIQFSPSGASQLFVSDTVISNNGSGANGVGILIKPTGSGSAKAVLNRIQVEGNALGISVDGTGSTGTGLQLLLRDSVVSDSVNSGITITGPAGGQTALLMMDRSASVANGTTGVIASGTGATILIGNSAITLNNGIGVGVGVGGTVFSFKNNSINGNTGGDGTPVTGTGLN
ncbi:MAG: right-handed parallel beta-helix repeat-containing protein [Alphaproteobacteria bacterium]